VQGVFYRVWTKETADRMMLTGWVRNVRKDKSVEALVIGDEDQVRKFISALYKGPEDAKVTVIEVKDGVDLELKSFEIRDTV
jgi:acylphosphatase